jgi:hypothetical protein
MRPPFHEWQLVLAFIAARRGIYGMSVSPIETQLQISRLFIN